MTSVWLVHPFFFPSGSSVDYSSVWRWRLDSWFVSKVFSIIDIEPLTFFRFKLADWWNSDRSSKQYYLLAR